MRDEEYVYFQDLKEKKVTGYSARKQRSHCGKAGCILPSDYLTKKEIKNMNGECKSYRLNEPMTYAEFKTLPDDLKVAYIMAIREKYNAPNVEIAKMMGTSKDALYLVTKKLGVSNGTPGKKKWDKRGFMEWCYGVPAPIEEPAAEEATVDEVAVEITEETCEAVEEATPVTEECPYNEIPNPGIKVNLINAEEEMKEEEIRFKKCVPATGSMTYEGMTFDILSSISDLLGNTKVLLSVKWDVVED